MKVRSRVLQPFTVTLIAETMPEAAAVVTVDALVVNQNEGRNILIKHADYVLVYLLEHSTMLRPKVGILYEMRHPERLATNE